MLTLLLGTDWVSNRRVILDKLARDVKDRKGNRILMVPELISHDTERRLSATAGATASRYAEVLSFTRLARRVSEFVGHGAAHCLDDGGRIVAMASAVDQISSRLKAYAAVSTKPEFLTGLVDAIDEFKRCCITSSDLMRASKGSEGGFAQKLEELALILEAYDSVCQWGKRDPRDQMTWLLEELEVSQYGQEHVFYIDGFPDFTRQHFAILEYLIRVSPQVTVSLNCDKPGSDLLAFEKAGETALALLRAARAEGIEYEIVTITPSQGSLQQIAERLFQGNIDECCTPQLQIAHADSIYQECVTVAEQIMVHIHRGDRFRDMNVVCADMGNYQNTLAMVFERCGIPYYISGTENILDKPVIATVIAALDAALGGFEQADVLRYLKTALSPLSPEECDQMENYVILWGITGRKWLQDWQMHPSGLDGQLDDKAVEVLRCLNQARMEVIEPLRQLRQAFMDAANVGQQVLALYRFLTQIRLAEQLQILAEKLNDAGDNRTAQILNQLWDILVTAMEQMYDVLGGGIWDQDVFARLLKLLLSQYSVGTIPTVLDRVTAGPVSAMRCQEGKHLFVLGAIEGALPGYGTDGGILSDRERIALRQLGVPLMGGGADSLQIEFSEIFGVFCGATKTALVTCPSGQPSFLFKRLERAAGGVVSPSQLGSVPFNKREAAAYFARMNDGVDACNLGLESEYHWAQNTKNYTHGAVEMENIRRIYGDHLKLSASQIDKQADCRMSYFLKYGLRAKERKPATVDPAEFGTYVHHVLEMTARQIVQKGGFKAVDKEEALQIASQHSKTYIESRFRDLDSQRIAYLIRRNSQELSLIVEELWNELHESEFQPVMFELNFGGVDEELPAIYINGSSMSASVRGFVDRVDLWNANARRFYRVVDYKTGKKDFDYCDVFNGLGLQMLLYLFALEHTDTDFLGKDPRPAGVQYFPARAPLVSADGLLDDGEAAAEREKIWKRKGLLLRDEEVIRAMEPAEKPVRIGVTRKKDGALTGDLADSGQLAMLRGYIFRLLGQMVDEIASGKVEANPYTRGSSHNACWYCPYGAVCHQAQVPGRRNYERMTAERFWDELGKEMNIHG